MSDSFSFSSFAMTKRTIKKEIKAEMKMSPIELYHHLKHFDGGRHGSDKNHIVTKEQVETLSSLGALPRIRLVLVYSLRGYLEDASLYDMRTSDKKIKMSKAANAIAEKLISILESGVYEPESSFFLFCIDHAEAIAACLFEIAKENGEIDGSQYAELSSLLSNFRDNKNHNL